MEPLSAPSFVVTTGKIDEWYKKDRGVISVFSYRAGGRAAEEFAMEFLFWLECRFWVIGEFEAGVGEVLSLALPV